MSDTITDPPQDDADVLAGEFYLGLLQGEDLRRAEALRHGHQGFNLAYAAWEARLIPLAEALAPVTPPARLWAAIAARTGPEHSPGLWQSLKFWRYFGLGAGALGAALAAALLVFVLQPPPAPVPVATALLATKSQGLFVATAETTANGTLVVLSPAQVRLPPDKSAELWLILPGAKPAALGLLPSNRTVTLRLSPAQLGGGLGQVTLAVSIEPLGGSPTGQATGPVVAAAKFSAI